MLEVQCRNIVKANVHGSDISRNKNTVHAIICTSIIMVGRRKQGYSFLLQRTIGPCLFSWSVRPRKEPHISEVKLSEAHEQGLIPVRICTGYLSIQESSQVFSRMTKRPFRIQTKKFQLNLNNQPLSIHELIILPVYMFWKLKTFLHQYNSLFYVIL